MKHTKTLNTTGRINSSNVSELLDYLLLVNSTIFVRNTNLRGNCGWAVAVVQAKVHEADQVSQILWGHVQICSDYSPFA